MTYSINQIASLLHLQEPAHPHHITHLLTDSRSLLKPEGTLFIALHTSSGDGHNFIRNLYDRGVRNFIVEHLPADSVEMPEANFLVVPSSLEALQSIAAAHRAEFLKPVVGITGSRGKTTVKEWAHHLLKNRFATSRSPRSYNSQIGVPLSVWNIDHNSDIALIEAGISKPGEMERLEKIIKPTIGVFTNIGGAHSAGFSSIEEKCREKALLFQSCEKVIYCADNKFVAEAIPQTCQHIGWSVKDDSQPLYISRIDSVNGFTEIEYAWKENGVKGKLTIPFTSAHDIENAINCLALMLTLGMKSEEIAEGMESLNRVNTRLEVIEGTNGCMIVEDKFTADLQSLAQALDFTDRRKTPDQTKTLILGELTDDNLNCYEIYQAAAEICRASGVEKVILIGNPDMAADFGPLATGYDSVADMLSQCNSSDFQNELILIKGAPGQGFDLIRDMLEASQHGTVLEIDLDAVVENFNWYRSMVKPTTGIVCMIKASGYGAGAGELAKTLQTQGAAYLAVAVHDEGAQLRREGITMPIIVLNPLVDDFSTLFKNKLEPEIFSIDFLRKLISEAKRMGVKDYPVHIKIDSGMHRLGFRLETLPEVIEVLKDQDYVVPRSIFSHLCAADDPMEDDYTQQQFDYFDRCCAMLTEAFPERKILRHILNSTGITRFPEHQYDMVRLGIGLYGVRTMHDGSQDALRPVSTLSSVIISLKHWPAGTTIGYNRRGVLKRDSVIATVPIGYADGLNRHFGCGNASFDLDGHACPTVGNICMDACMIDVTDVPGVAVGQRVEIFGNRISVDSLASTLGTIPYEVLTSISERVKRIYFRE
ncbi:MAG: bifunctional UDP-N-acetylmuramoyl-tripeptide:D-alanyl-D-alanine ligase/alanine racemase [Muribaculaceae bacterium]|nr:bifunctional UDP-N-acetylmuramoyl-tripeptide:D-alanyl-D-alanine ligase/alanine racemase [Muribaculaceae bacterium]